jgi:hypothetical protein
MPIKASNPTLALKAPLYRFRLVFLIVLLLSHIQQNLKSLTYPLVRILGSITFFGFVFHVQQNTTASNNTKAAKFADLGKFDANEAVGGMASLETSGWRKTCPPFRDATSIGEMHAKGLRDFQLIHRGPTFPDPSVGPPSEVYYYPTEIRVGGQGRRWRHDSHSFPGQLPGHSLSS